MVITPAPAGQGVITATSNYNGRRAMGGGEGGAMFGGSGGEYGMRESYTVDLQMMMMMMGGGGGSRRRRRSRLSSSSPGPCAACKLLRRKCRAGECVFAPYFPPEEPAKFASVHKVFGASNVSKLLLQLSPTQRRDAVSTLVFEAEARIQDPVYGCVAAISLLQRHLLHLQQQLALVHAHAHAHRPSSQKGNEYVYVSNQQPASGLASPLGMSRLQGHKEEEELYSSYNNALLDSSTSAAGGRPLLLNHQQHQVDLQQRRGDNKTASAAFLDLQHTVASTPPPPPSPRRRHHHAEAYHPYSRLPTATTTDKRLAGGLAREHNFLLDCNIPHLQAQKLCRSSADVVAESGPNLLCSAYNHLQLFDPSYNLGACHDNPALSHDGLNLHDVCDAAAEVAVGNSRGSPMQAEVLSEKNHLGGGGAACTDEADMMRLENVCQPRQSSFSTSAASSTTSTTSASMHELMIMQQLVNGSINSNNIRINDQKQKPYVDNNNNNNNNNSRILDMLRNESCISNNNANNGDSSNVMQQEDCVCTSMAASLMMMQDPVMMSRSAYSYHTHIA